MKNRLPTDFAENFAKLTTNWKLPESKAEIMMSEYAAIHREVGAERFNEAVQRILHSSEYQFFPTISEFRAHIPALRKPASCGKCESGWIRVPDLEARRLYKNETATAMIRCECRKGPKFQEYERRVVGWKP